MNNEINIFISYSHKDEQFRESLEEHLSVLKRNGKITSWADRKIIPGQNWSGEIDQHLKAADIILLLISTSFTSSPYCMDTELALALEQHEAGLSIVIPIFIRPADLQGLPFMAIQGLPKDALPVDEWENKDRAWLDVAKGIRMVVDEIQIRRKRAEVPAELSSIKETLADLIDGLARQYDSNSSIRGHSTGLIDLDLLTDGMHSGQLFTIASRPSMGKTSLALCIAAEMAILTPVLIFSTCTSKRQITERLLSNYGNLNFLSLQRTALLDSDWPGMAHAVKTLSEALILLDDTVRPTFSEIREKCLQAKNTFGALSLVVLDSVHYLEEFSTNSEDVGRVAKELKRLAREFECCVLVTVSIGRAIDTRPNKRPILGDLAEWVRLGEESDVVAFVYVDAYYNPDTPDPGVAEIIVGRNQYGPVGTVRVTRTPERGVFRTMSPSHPGE